MSDPIFVEEYRGYRILKSGELFGLDSFAHRFLFPYSSIEGARGAIDAIFAYLETTKAADPPERERR